MECNLGKLLIFIASVSKCIRMNSSYNRASFSDHETPERVMWLSDMFHDVDTLGQAVVDGNPTDVRNEANRIANSWNCHREQIEKAAQGKFSLDEGIGILESLSVQIN